MVSLTKLPISESFVEVWKSDQKAPSSIFACIKDILTFSEYLNLNI